MEKEIIEYIYSAVIILGIYTLVYFVIRENNKKK